MALVRETPTCLICGKIIATKSYEALKLASKLSQLSGGNVHVGWTIIPHDCKRKIN